jgi:cation diffusion facilitator family transporter
MTDSHRQVTRHSHVFLGEGHQGNERKTWVVIALCSIAMLVEIVGGLMFGSIALVADGVHMSTHAGAILLTALAYGYARKHAGDHRFSFGTGKFGDLAGFTSAIILAMIAILVCFEAFGRLFTPVPIHFGEAIPIASVGLAVNVASAWLLSGDHHHHHDADHDHGDHQQMHAATHRDNSMRAAIVHVVADAAVSVLVICGLLLASAFGWFWMDPVAGIIGACVIASWAYSLVRDTGSILLDMNPDKDMTRKMRAVVESDGDELADFHLWRLGPGHLGAILSIITTKNRDADYYRAKLASFQALSHLTVELSRKT